MVEILSPLAKAKLIIGIHQQPRKQDNEKHKHRHYQDYGQMLDIPYSRILVGVCLSLENKVFNDSTHGCSASVQEHTKLNAVVKLAKMISADIVSYSHTHGSQATLLSQYLTAPKQDSGKQAICLSHGSLYGMGHSYAQEKITVFPK